MVFAFHKEASELFNGDGRASRGELRWRRHRLHTSFVVADVFVDLVGCVSGLADSSRVNVRTRFGNTRGTPAWSGVKHRIRAFRFLSVLVSHLSFRHRELWIQKAAGQRLCHCTQEQWLCRRVKADENAATGLEGVPLNSNNYFSFKQGGNRRVGDAGEHFLQSRFESMRLRDEALIIFRVAGRWRWGEVVCLE